MGLIFKNPSKSSQNYLNQIGPTITPYFQPYINAGQQAMGQLQGQYGTLLENGVPLQKSYQTMASNPTGVIQGIGSHYQESPGAEWQMQQGESAIGNAQASGGMAGTPQDQQEAGALATNLTNQNFNNYMKMALGIGRQGLEGENNLYTKGLHGDQQLNEMGYHASSQLAEALAQSLMAQANNAYAGTANQNQHIGGMIGMASSMLRPFSGGSSSGTSNSWGGYSSPGLESEAAMGI